jgi:hypothetical protein
MLYYFIFGFFVGLIFSYLLYIPKLYISFKDKINLQQKIQRLESLQKDEFTKKV